MEEVLKKIAEIENKESLGTLSDTEKIKIKGKLNLAKKQ